MIELLAVHGANKRNVVNTAAEMRQQVRQLHATLAMTTKRPRAPHKPHTLLLNKREFDLPKNRLGHRLAIELV